MQADKGTAGLKKNAMQQSTEQLYTVKAVNNWAWGLNSAYRVSSCEPKQVFNKSCDAYTAHAAYRTTTVDHRTGLVGHQQQQQQQLRIAF